MCDCCPRAGRWPQLLEKDADLETVNAFCMVHGAWQSMSQPFTPELLTAHTLRRPLFSYLTGFWGVLCWLQVAKTPNPDLLNSDPGASNLIVSKSSISSRRQLINGKYSDKIPNDLSNKCELAALFMGSSNTFVEKTLKMGKTEGRRRRERQRMKKCSSVSPSNLTCLMKNKLYIKLISLPWNQWRGRIF